MIDEEGAKGTPLYMAPEVMLGDEFNEKADVYSFGIILWEVLTRSEPFSNHSDFDVFVEAVCMQNERPPLPKDCLPSLRKLITACWSGNPSLRPSFPTIVDTLETILIECAVEDEVARSIWKNYFFRKENVSWVDEFVPIVAQFMGNRFTDPAKNEQAYYDEIDRLITTLDWQCLQKILPEKREAELAVNLEKFGQVLCWFGPFKDKDGKSRILEKIKSTLSRPWFFGNISYEGALEYLSDKEKGTFMIRFSSKENPGCFTISKVNQKKKIVHQRIMHKAGSSFTLSEKSFDSLDELVKHGDFKLERACPGSPFAFLFVETSLKNSSQPNLYTDDDDDE
jgi:serine/threonine protein kinase